MKYTVMVNYDRSIEDRVKDGKYDWANSDITSSHFPSQETGIKEVSIEFIHFRRNMKTDDILGELDKKGLRPATLKELLSLGEQYPDLQREFPIIALGSVWRLLGGIRCYAFLSRCGFSGRRLGLDWLWLGIRKRGGRFFIAVRK